MTQDYISVRGARTHNLKNISVDIPRNKMVVITGLSGSGKSSLAFDTIFAEGQRRYVESLRAYARQFLGQMEKPDVDQIEGLSPAVSIDQRGASSNPRSTVGTTTEIYDYLRLLYARVGIPHCPVCGREVQMQTADQIVDAVAALPEGRRIQILAPLIKDRKGHHQQVFEDIRKAGYVRVRVDGVLHDVNETIELDRYKNHTIEAVVDRLIIKPDLERSRLADSIETALRLGDGVVIVNDVTDKEPVDHIYSERFACAYDGTSLPEIEPRTFSFNTPHGACETCQGLGNKLADRSRTDRAQPRSIAQRQRHRRDGMEHRGSHATATTRITSVCCRPPAIITRSTWTRRGNHSTTRSARSCCTAAATRRFP